jgi:T5SS/PEP-CTERM-associated repeat protein
MKKLITLFAIAGMVLALAPAAQAEITATGEIADWTKTVDGSGNWDVTGGAGSSRPAGTLVINDTGTANLVNSTSEHIFLGGGVGGEMTVNGSGAEFRTGSAQFRVGAGGTGELTVTNGGFVNLGNLLYLGHNAAGYALVTGAGSKLTSPLIAIGYAGGHDANTHILTVADGGLVRTDSLRFSFDESGSDVGGYVDMAAGGILAVLGNKTALSQTALFSSGGLFTKFNAANVGEIQYHNGTTWVDMTLAPASAYTLTYSASGPTINGQDLGGYTVLTMAGGTTPAPSGTVIMFK